MRVMSSTLVMVECFVLILFLHSVSDIKGSGYSKIYGYLYSVDFFIVSVFVFIILLDVAFRMLIVELFFLLGGLFQF